MIDPDEAVTRLHAQSVRTMSPGVPTDLRCMFGDEHDRCPNDGAYMVVFIRADGAPILMLFCDECEPAVRARWDARTGERLFATLQD